jgi:hypothetical protein
VVVTGPVAGSDEDVVGSLMATIMQAVLMCAFCADCESAVSRRSLGAFAVAAGTASRLCVGGCRGSITTSARHHCNQRRPPR